MDTIPTGLDDELAKKLMADSIIDPHNCATGFGIETKKFYYISKGMPVRLELASRMLPELVAASCADTMFSKTVQVVSTSRKQSVKEYLVNMAYEYADALIAKYNKDLNEPR